MDYYNGDDYIDYIILVSLMEGGDLYSQHSNTSSLLQPTDAVSCYELVANCFDVAFSSADNAANRGSCLVYCFAACAAFRLKGP